MLISTGDKLINCDKVIFYAVCGYRKYDSQYDSRNIIWEVRAYCGCDDEKEEYIQVKAYKQREEAENLLADIQNAILDGSRMMSI